jgi:DNA polymerase elongation subunit (family B)
MYNWVVSFDLNSLYPHLIMQYNISPETLVQKIEFPSIDYLLKGDWEYRDATYSYAANGTCYRKDKQGFLAELMETMYNDRTKYKKLMIEAKKEYEKTKNKELEKDISRYHNMQMAKKIQLNSAYGALANQYFRWFNNDLAEAITASGQLSIRWIERKMNAFMNKSLKTSNVDYVIASDTDSIYVTMETLVDKIETKDELKIVDAIDKFCEQIIQPNLDKWYQELADMMNAYQQKMEMKRECIANKGIWTAKKRYILNVYNQEGVAYEKPKLKMQGIEAVRSSTPMSVRKTIKDALDVIMNKDQEAIINFINDFRDKFNKLPFEEVAFPRGCKGLDKYIDAARIYKKGTPIQVKAALLYNNLLDKKDLKKYPKISEGDKIKFCYLKVPNPIHDTVIATPGALPKQFGLDNYIDYDMQFDKAFLEPLKTILDAIGWKTEKQSTLEDLFS